MNIQMQDLMSLMNTLPESINELLAASDEVISLPNLDNLKRLQVANFIVKDTIKFFQTKAVKQKPQSKANGIPTIQNH